MDSSDICGSRSSSWLEQDSTLCHPEQWRNARGVSLQDIRTYYLQNEQHSYAEHRDVDTSVEKAPWYMIEPSADLTSSLCSVCKHINFEWLLRNQTSRNSGPILLLQHMLASRSSCNFCHLAITSLCTADGAHLRPEDLFQENEVMCCFLTSNFSTGAEDGPTIVSIWRRIFGVTGGFLAPVAQIQEIGDLSNQCFGRHISSSADLPLIKAWLTTCEKEHEDTAAQESLLHRQITGSKLQLRLLDVEDECIVCMDHGTRYVALSYVWGKVTQLRLLLSNFDLLTAKGALSQDSLGAQLPRTISDAKQLAKNLGERYLWVDALCLIQDGPDSAAEVQSMDIIYGNAAWTLVSGSAADANSPLPRLGTDLESGIVSQLKEVIAGKNVAVLLPCLENVLQGSIWNQRAWTYQESVLSRRLLIVTNPQMFFTCRHGYTFYEDTRIEDIPPSQNYEDGQFFTGAAGPMTNFERYTNVVQEYTTRQISFHEDALNAISGVLSSFRSWFRSDFAHGLPRTELDQALLWQPTGNLPRRKDKQDLPLFSSWSWVGWIGSCRYPSGLALSRMQWKVEGPKEPIYVRSDALRGAKDGGADWYQRQWTEKFMDDPIGMDMQTFDSCWYEGDMPNLLFLHPVAPETQRTGYTMLGSQDSHLHFRALTCELYVAGDHTTDLGVHIGIPCSDNKHTVCALNVYDADHRICGTIHVTRSLAASLAPGEHEFIRLSRTHLVSDSTRYHYYPTDWDEFESPSDDTLEEWLGVDLDDDDDYEVLNDTNAEDNVTFDGQMYVKDVPWCVYNVMLVETKDGVSQRVGLGKVHINAFLQNSGSAWRDVVLK